MIVWLVTVGEPLPTDPGSPRLLRAGILSDMLARRGHTVHWWSSSFDHQLKTQRCETYREITIHPNATLHLLPGRSYRSNVSLARIGNHRDNAAAFRIWSRQSGSRPDLILCSYPTAELCEAAIDFGLERSVPVVVDVRDLWPDIFEELVPTWARSGLRAVLGPMHRQARRVFARATAVTGVTAEFVDWGLKRGGRRAGAKERAFPMAYVERLPSPDALAAANSRWATLGVTSEHLNFVFFGTIGRQFDLSTVIAAARQVADERVRFVICGVGDRLEQYRAEAAGCKNIVFAGWIDAAMIRALMPISYAGLAPYHLSDNFNSNLPNKIIEYLAGGLPILTTLSGVPGQLLATHRCGVTYHHSDATALAKAIDDLVSTPAHQREMSTRALALYREQFDAERVYGEMIDHLELMAVDAGNAAANTPPHAAMAA